MYGKHQGGRPTPPASTPEFPRPEEPSRVNGDPTVASVEFLRRMLALAVVLAAS
eukprot:CAMPEP_0180259928 /NCGR_PEP_ID=MMETSP0987-20121128/43282_1 /TAXON_ID=697907 /ORGANISM="non described non described, Strain CCMP2293" /LENGTH=53 /DNA_ID=CAMNT_0022229669 /DNA_START=33 /DNA_END=194 /DNA_ORIENTATION=-